MNVSFQNTALEIAEAFAAGGTNREGTADSLRGLFNEYLSEVKCIPYVNASYGCRLVPEKLWLCITVGLDAKGTWGNNILENSRYGRLQVVIRGDKFVVEYFSGSLPRHLGAKFRKCSVRTIGEVVEKIASWTLGGAK